MELNSITPEELRKYVLKEAQKIDDWKLYFYLKGLKLKRLTPHQRSFRILKYAIILHRLGLPISSDMISFIEGTDVNIFNILHTLGDKHLLIFKRKSGRYEWMLNTQLLGEFIEGED